MNIERKIIWVVLQIVGSNPTLSVLRKERNSMKKLNFVNEDELAVKRSRSELKNNLYSRTIKNIESFNVEKFRREHGNTKKELGILSQLDSKEDNELELQGNKYFLKYSDLFMFDNYFDDKNSLLNIEIFFCPYSNPYLNTTVLILRLLSDIEYFMGIDNVSQVSLYENGMSVSVVTDDPQKTLLTVDKLIESKGKFFYETRGIIYNYDGTKKPFVLD